MLTSDALGSANHRSTPIETRRVLEHLARSRIVPSMLVRAGRSEAIASIIGEAGPSLQVDVLLLVADAGLVLFASTAWIAMGADTTGALLHGLRPAERSFSVAVRIANDLRTCVRERVAYDNVDGALNPRPPDGRDMLTGEICSVTSRDGSHLPVMSTTTQSAPAGDRAT